MQAGTIIKDLRIKKGFTQEQLAEKTELSARTIQRIENGEVDPRAYTLQMIAKALDVDYALLMPNETAVGSKVHQVDNSNSLGLLHLSGILPLIFPTILIWKSKKDKVKDIADHYSAVISFQCMICGVIIGCLWVYWHTNQLTPLFGILLANALFSIYNAIRVFNGENYIIMPFMKNKSMN